MDENEMDGFGYKVTIDIHCPDLGIVLNVKDKAYKSTATKHCHLTIIGVRQLSGNPFMHVVKVSGKNHDILVKLGVDSNQLALHDTDFNTKASLEDSIELLLLHCGERKLFLSLPSCKYKGVKIPGYLTFSECGVINTEILTNIFKRLDNLSLFNKYCDTGMIPFVLLDGHGSRFDVKFLEYMNNKSHKWNVCLGAPYRTAL